MTDLKLVPLVKLAPDPAAPFRCGDTVKLRGGRVKMTVKKASAKSVKTVWHDAGDGIVEDDFHPDMLEHCDANADDMPSPDEGDAA